MRALVLWADDRSANLGVRALAAGASTLARDAWPGIELELQDFAPSPDGFVFSRDILQQDLGRHSGPVKRFLQPYDVVLDTGAGDSFTDGYGIKRFLVMDYVRRTAAHIGMPLVLLPQTIGPFSRLPTRVLARRALRRAPLVMSRDSASASASAALGRAVDVEATDVVFALPAPPAAAVGRDVLLNVSGLLWNGELIDRNGFRDATLRLVSELRSRGRQVAFVTHVGAGDAVDDDTAVVADLVDALGPMEVLVPESLDQAREILASANLVIASRMHACLNALSSGTPAVAWAYSRKFAPLLTDIGWDATVDLHADPDPVASTLELIDQLDSAATATRLSNLQAEASRRLGPAVQAMRRIA